MQSDRRLSHQPVFPRCLWLPCQQLDNCVCLYVILFLTTAEDVAATPRTGEASLPAAARVWVHVTSSVYYSVCMAALSVILCISFVSQKGNGVKQMLGLEIVFLEGQIGMEILIFFLLRKHRSSVSLSFALINLQEKMSVRVFSSNYMLHLPRSQRSVILPFVGRAGVHPACPAAHT